MPPRSMCSPTSLRTGDRFRSRRKRLFPVVAIAAVVLLPACSAGAAASGPTVSTAVPTLGSTPPVSATAPGAELGADAGFTAPVVGASKQPAVPPGTEARFSEGLAVRVTSRTESTVTATSPGEVSGPAVTVTLTLRNGSTVPVDLDGIRVAASYAGQIPAPSVEGPPAQVPTGTLPPGASADATYVYSVPKGNLSSMSLEITSISSVDVVVVRS